MGAGRLTEPQGPWGALGVLNGLSDTDQLAVLNQLVEPERRRLQQNLTSAPIDRLRLERQLASVDPDAVPAVRQVNFPLAWIADELPPRAATAAAPSTYMASQGAHAVSPSAGANGMRMIGTDYWRAFIPARRAVELQRFLDPARPGSAIPLGDAVGRCDGAAVHRCGTGIHTCPRHQVQCEQRIIDAGRDDVADPSCVVACRRSPSGWIAVVVVECPTGPGSTGAHQFR